MKRKKIISIIAVLFIAAIVLLTFFSKTIDNMLLPQVKTCDAILGDMEGENIHSISFLVPKSAVIFRGDETVVYVVNTVDDETRVFEQAVTIEDSDEIYYLITGDYGVNTTAKVVYSTSKPLSDNERVFIAEEV